MSEAETLGSDIVRIQREARFADISIEAWGERLTRLIEAQSEVLGDVQVHDLRQVGTAAGGSNGTLLFSTTYATAAGPVDRQMVLRFLPVKGLFHDYDVAVQFNLQKALHAAGLPVPAQIWLDEGGEYLVRPGYVMAMVAGEGPPMTWMTSGVIADASPARRRQMTKSYVHSLAKIHAMDWKAAGLGWMERRAAGVRPIERETNWYWDALIWSGSARHIEMLSPVKEWLIANEPVGAKTVLCHGDANLGNYLFEDDAVSAVVDWEMSFLGAPECDLSFLLVGDAILQSDAPWPEGALTYDEMKAEYETASGHPLRDWDYYCLFTAYRIAIINVLAMNHFPPEVLAAFMPVLEKGPDLCLERARALGVAIPAQ
ncbi:MAG: phosphotransferase family protein [Caulobacter sp.]|nr:phosphotransferase family protein [Caulobacter sp.]